MIFHFLGRTVCRAWVLWLAGWILLLAVSWLVAPSWRVVAQDREFAFLPPDSPSRIADEEYAKAFPGDRLASNVVLVLHRTGNDPADLDHVLRFISDSLEPGLRNIAEAEGGLAYEVKPSSPDEPLFSEPSEPSTPPAPPPKRSIIGRIRTPNAPGSGALLVSPDEQALLVVVELTTEFLSNSNWPIIDKIQNLIGELRRQGKVPQGVDIALTGSAVIGHDHSLAELQSVRATGTLTVVLVVVLLVLIYRAPLLALIPLATVFLGVQLALNFLAILAGRGYITLFQGLQIYITILAYGAGVDYCLFLTARYKEELDRGSDPDAAVCAATRDVGPALVASAATVMCGIAMMLFARFGKFREAGFAIPLSLLLVLCATLTFSPSLLRLAGRWAFWPHRPGGDAGRGRAAAEGPDAPQWWQFYRPGELERIWDRVGQLLLRRAGTVWLVTVAVMAPFVVVAGLFYNQVSYDVIGTLPADATSAAGSRLLQEHFPAGIVGPVTVLLVDENLDFGSKQGRDVVARVTDRLHEQEAELGLSDVRSLTAPLGTSAAAKRDYSGLNLPAEARREGVEREARAHYLTALGGGRDVGTRLELTLAQSPFARQSIADLDRVESALRDALPAGQRADTRLYVSGTTASVRDLARVMQGDRTRIELLVLASTFLILIVLLRRFVVTVYLLLSVLFSYYVTMGVTFLVFWLLDPHGFNGIDWKVAIFLFTILIAVGEDYNIFLMTRVREEQRRHGPVRGVTEALDRTGPIISSCGIIMAGTFATLMAGSLTEMKQLGFALAFGVLLDTFVVRPILVPAFLILLNNGRLPLKGWGRKAPSAPAEAPASERAGSS